MKNIILISPGKDLIIKEYPDDYFFTLQELQRLVGGNIETVPTLFNGIEMLVNEEGKLTKLPVNIVATSILHTSVSDCIVGDAALVTIVNDDFDGLSSSSAERIIKWISGIV